MKPFLVVSRTLAKGLCGLCFSIAALPAFGWNSGGHRLTVAIAWPLLSERAQQALAQLIDAHPAVEQWRKRARHPWPGALLGEASTWPDELRRNAKQERERAATGGSPPKADADGEVHPDWHYFDWPIGRPRNEARGGQLEAQIHRQSAIVADATQPSRERAIALSWLVHLTGDAHMPLHVATWRDESGDWTAGGNGLRVIDAAHPWGADTNLHRFWDDLPASPWLRGKPLLERAGALNHRYSASLLEAANAAPERWVDDAHRLAAQIVPRAELDANGVFTVTDDYRASAQVIADRQVTLAGLRLARWLEQLLVETAEN